MEARNGMITDSMIAQGDQLGAQMSTLAEIIYLAEVNQQEIVFWDELKNFRRGFQFLDVFECNGIKIISGDNKAIRAIASRIKRINTGNWKGNMKKAYFSRFNRYKDRLLYELIRCAHKDFERKKNLCGGKHCDASLLTLNPGRSYDIVDGFGTYQDWKKSGDRVKSVFTFKKSIAEEGDRLFNNLELKGMKPVSVHFRLADYLVLASLNLSLDYYKKAMQYFDDSKTVYIVFSDEINKVKNLFSEELDNKSVIYMDESNSAAMDMYLMTKCSGGNIIANSTFSFWGAYLNKSPDKKVICPKNFVGENTNVNYINGNYYPENWIAL